MENQNTNTMATTKKGPKYSWDEYLAFCKENKIKLKMCFNSEVSKYSKYTKYIGKEYLTIEKRDYSNSDYASPDMWNTITFTWGEYSKELEFHQTEQMPESVDYLKAALTWYEDLRDELKNPSDELVSYVMDFYGGIDPTWDFFENNPITKSEVKLAVKYYRKMVSPITWDHEGYCDSIDRELVRDILFIQKGMATNIKEQLEYGGLMSKFFTPKGKVKKKYETLLK